MSYSYTQLLAVLELNKSIRIGFEIPTILSMSSTI